MLFLWKELENSVRNLFVFCACAYVCVHTYAQAQELVPTEVVNAFKVGNANLLSKYLSARTTININGVSQNYTISSARKVLRTFFAKHPPLRFTPIYEGITEEQEESLVYYIAVYQSEQTYNVYLFFSTPTPKLKKIRKIILEKEE